MIFVVRFGETPERSACVEGVTADERGFALWHDLCNASCGTKEHEMGSTTKYFGSGKGCSAWDDGGFEELGEAAEESLRSLQGLVEGLCDLEGLDEVRPATVVRQPRCHGFDTIGQVDELLNSVLRIVGDVNHLADLLMRLSLVPARPVAG